VFPDIFLKWDIIYATEERCHIVITRPLHRSDCGSSFGPPNIRVAFLDGLGPPCGARGVRSQLAPYILDSREAEPISFVPCAWNVGTFESSPWRFLCWGYLFLNVSPRHLSLSRSLIPIVSDYMASRCYKCTCTTPSIPRRMVSFSSHS
jgi:hypothetical protein